MEQYKKFNNAMKLESPMSKKFLLSFIVFILICSQNISGQVLVHTFNETYTAGFNTFSYNPRFNEDINYFIGRVRSISTISNTTTYDFRMYKNDYSLYKTVTFGVPGMPSSYPYTDMSKYIFNDDDKVEFLWESTTNLYLFNEDGDMLHNFGANNNNVRFNPQIFKNGDYWYLSIERNTGTGVNSTHTQIFRLQKVRDDEKTVLQTQLAEANNTIIDLQGQLNTANNTINILQVQLADLKNELAECLNSSFVETQHITTVQLHPNPAQNFVHIQADFWITKIEVFNQSGVCVLREENPTDKINLKGFVEGIYFVRIYGENGVMTQKLVVK
jgi:hypothetical protein